MSRCPGGIEGAGCLQRVGDCSVGRSNSGAYFHRVSFSIGRLACVWGASASFLRVVSCSMSFYDCVCFFFKMWVWMQAVIHSHQDVPSPAPFSPGMPPDGGHTCGHCFMNQKVFQPPGQVCSAILPFGISRASRKTPGKSW